MIIHSKLNITHDRYVANTGSIPVRPITETFNGTDEVTFNFEVTSEANTLPLTTELRANNVNKNMHGTTITCLLSRDSDPLTTFVVHVLGGRCGDLKIICQLYNNFNLSCIILMTFPQL